ncbi:MAG: magnesium transporter [Planctomycetales bacterium]|nr:magnesium transporter [Planctomycetales bacterium]
MINTLYLPELREMLREQNHAELREFCETLHPARTAEFMEGLNVDEAWQVLSHTDEGLRSQIFSFFEQERQVEIIATQPREEIASLITELPHDDRVDLLAHIDEEIVEDLLARLPSEERRDINRLRQYPEGTAGSVMTTDFAKLGETLSVSKAFEELGRQAEQLETIYYIYVVDDEDHLLGVVSTRQLVSAMGRPNEQLGELMETNVEVCLPTDRQADVVHKVAKFDLLAIPVVDHQRRMLGIITHDDIIDVMAEEAAEDVYRIGAVDPLEETYLKTSLLTLSWKRGIWLTILFFAALLTAYAMNQYEKELSATKWLVLFVPLVISSGGNTGNQSATLIIAALNTGGIALRDWRRVVRRELAMGLILGTFLAIIGYVATLLKAPPDVALVIPVTLLLVVLCGTLSGALLPLLFKRLGLDPAMMSNPFVAVIVDILGIVIYMNVARLFL